VLRDFTVQPATGGSPAGKAYTHQFPEHVFLYLGMFSLSMSYFSTVKLDAGSWSNIDCHFMATYHHHHQSMVCDSQNTITAKLHRKQHGPFDEKLFVQSQWQRTCNTKMYTVLSHRLRNCALFTTKNTDHWDCCIVHRGLPYLRTAWQIGIPYSENHKDHNHHQLVTSQPATAEEKERENERERESLWERVLRLPGSFVEGLVTLSEYGEKTRTEERIIQAPITSRAFTSDTNVRIRGTTSRLASLLKRDSVAYREEGRTTRWSRSVAFAIGAASRSSRSIRRDAAFLLRSPCRRLS